VTLRIRFRPDPLSSVVSVIQTSEGDTKSVESKGRKSPSRAKGQSPGNVYSGRGSSENVARWTRTKKEGLGKGLVPFPAMWF